MGAVPPVSCVVSPERSLSNALECPFRAFVHTCLPPGFIVVIHDNGF